MRIAIVTETYPPEINGVALTVHNLVTELTALGHRVDLTRPRQPGESTVGDTDGQAPRVHHVAGASLPRYPGLRFGWPAPRSLRATWQESGIEAVYVATEGPLGWSAVRQARRLGLPVFTGFHTRFDDFVTHYGARLLVPLAQAWLRRFHNAATATLVPTTALRDELRARGFERVEQLRRGVDTRLFHPSRRDPELRQSLGVSGNELLVIHVGRFAAEKNLGLAIRAFREIERHHPGAKFVWVGDGPMRSELAARHPDFLFVGMKRGVDLARHFASGDLFLFPSLTETYGNVTVEALASGVPTVAFDYGAAHEHICHGHNGAVAPVDQPDRFVEAAVQLAASPSLRRGISIRARETMAPLSQRAVAEQLVHLMQGAACAKGVA